MTIDWKDLTLAAGYPNMVEMFWDLYWDQNKSIEQIGKYLGVSSTAIIRQFKRFGLRFRPQGRSGKKPENKEFLKNA